MHFQFERIGFFVVDFDSDVENNKYVFNLTVTLKDVNKPKASGNKSRKEEQDMQLSLKLVSFN